MHRHADKTTDEITKTAWEKNWEDISVSGILQIFGYDRVKKQMEIFLRVLPKNEKILEGGCGLAPYLIRLRQLGYDVEGIDYNEAPVKKVLQFDPKLPVRVGDVTAIPYPDATFGAYISLGVIEHFTEGPEKAIREARRVLKPGGVFVVFVPQNTVFMRLGAPLRYLKSRPALRRLFKKPEDNHYWEQYFDRSKLAQTLEREGFRVEEFHALDHSHALISSCGLFRDKDTLDEASPAGLRVSRWMERYLKWQTCATLGIICYKR